MATTLPFLSRAELDYLRARMAQADTLDATEPGQAQLVRARLISGLGPKLLTTLDALLPIEAPEGHTLTHCSRCDALIVMSRHARTGHPAPIEVAVSEKGNCLLQADGTYTIISRPDARADYKGRLHLNHFATCPCAAEFGRR